MKRQSNEYFHIMKGYQKYVAKNSLHSKCFKYLSDSAY